jgi:Flp pilus assembly protein TadG
MTSTAPSPTRRAGPASRADRRRAGDGGFAALLTALMIVPILIASAFAVDVGAWYAQAARTQRAADAASLAGVVWLPDAAAAISASNIAIARNWTVGATAPKCGDKSPASSYTVTCTALSSTQWKVNISSPAPTYFGKVAGMSSMSVGRGATGSFNPAIPMGSPYPSFANNLKPPCTDPSTCTTDGNGNPQPFLWASINAPYSNHTDGDPFATRCWGTSGSSSSCSTSGYPGANPSYASPLDKWNPYYNPDGYLLAVDVATAGATVTVELYDPVCNTGGNAGDGVTGNCSSQPQGTEFLLYNYSGSTYQYNADSNQEPGNILKDTTGTYCRKQYKPATSGVGTDSWTTLCTFTASSAGVYPLRVRNDNITGVCDMPAPVAGVPVASQTTACTGEAINNYAVRASASTGTTKVYALDNMSIYTGYSGSTANFYLAQIDTRYKGRDLVVDLYDPGDGSDTKTYTMKLLGPGGVSWPCTYWDTVGQLDPQSGTSSSPTCSLVTHNSSGSPYNGRWLHFQVTLTGYSCTTDCWWKINYVFGSGSSPTDRTVWATRILGDPVHLIN